MSDEFKNNTNARLSVAEERLRTHEDRIGELEEKSDEVIKLSTLMERQIKSDEKQTETLDNINQNLVGLNNKMDNFEDRVNKLEGDENLTELKDGFHTVSTKVDRLEKDLETKTVDLNKLHKTIITRVIPAIFTAGILGFLGWLIKLFISTQ